jgi:hypothetical protein
MVAFRIDDAEGGRRAGRGAWRRSVLVALALGAGPLAANCKGGGSSEAGGGPCATVYRDQCGTRCAGDDGACPAGLFCGDGACTAQCTPESGCDAGQTCSPRGRCVASGAGEAGAGGGPGFGGGGPRPSAGGAGEGSCPGIDLAFERVTPNVVLLIDQSGSMRCPLELNRACGEEDEIKPDQPQYDTTRWAQLRSALLADDGPIAQLQDQIAFGLALYSYEGPGTEDPAACPVLTPKPDPLAIETGGYERLKLALNSNEPKSETPTGDSVRAVAGALAALGGERPNYLVIATDGNPDTCKTPNGAGDEAKALSIAEAKAAYAKGVTSFVIGISKFGADKDHLQRLALAGQNLPEGTAEQKYYDVTNQAELVKAFNDVIFGVRSCTFDLDAKITREAAPKGNVTVDDAAKDFEAPDGWRLVDDDTIEFVGAACKAIKEGAGRVKATFPCGTSGITPKPRLGRGTPDRPRPRRPRGRSTPGGVFERARHVRAPLASTKPARRRPPSRVRGPGGATLRGASTALRRAPDGAAAIARFVRGGDSARQECSHLDAIKCTLSSKVLFGFARLCDNVIKRVAYRPSFPMVSNAGTAAAIAPGFVVRRSRRRAVGGARRAGARRGASGSLWVTLL